MATKGYCLPVPFYLQADCEDDKNVMCGAACTQMVIHDIASLPTAPPGEQDTYFDEITNPTSGGGVWHNPPWGMRRVLNDRDPATRPPARSTLPASIQNSFTQVPVD